MRGGLILYQPIKGKVVFLTGGGIGIGRAIAQKMAQYGASVVVTDLDLKTAEETVSTLESTLPSQKHSARMLDVTKSADVTEAIDEVAREYGQLDILLNNAGVSTMNRVEDISDKEWAFNFDVNSTGVFYCTRAAIPHLKESKGVIVNTASMASYMPAPLLTHYAASKAAVAHFTKSVAVELGPYDIKVNCVCPGYVKTSMQEREAAWEGELRGMTPKEVIQDYIDATPMGRLCLPEDVANVVGFLVSPEASFVTGEAVHVGGGAQL
ncbi:MAG: SDR family oxidoreductase [Clostridiaceae bacterium]|nr:SDR family oxidoreductase [Clostridiaceae bacterium]